MFKSNLDSKLDVNLLPMIDVMFFLVIFFMLFTTFRVTPAGIEVNLPQAKTASEQQEKQTNIRVNISDDGQLALDDKLVSRQDLKSQVRELIADNQDLLFIIKADKKVEYERIVAVMDTIRQVGGHRLALAADKQDRDPKQEDKD
ncbi:ExbD/TolR family protein [Halanaerobaculum tunisiense]